MTRTSAVPTPAELLGRRLYAALGELLEARTVARDANQVADVDDINEALKALSAAARRIDARATRAAAERQAEQEAAEEAEHAASQKKRDLKNLLGITS